MISRSLQSWLGLPSGVFANSLRPAESHKQWHPSKSARGLESPWLDRLCPELFDPILFASTTASNSRGATAHEPSPRVGCWPSCHQDESTPQCQIGGHKPIPCSRWIRADTRLPAVAPSAWQAVRQKPPGVPYPKTPRKCLLPRPLPLLAPCLP